MKKEYFLRFTNDPYSDLSRGFSFFKGKQKLKGLCGFRLAETEQEFSELNLNRVIQQYQNNFGYSGNPVIFSGEWVGQGPIEGCLFKAHEIEIDLKKGGRKYGA